MWFAKENEPVLPEICQDVPCKMYHASLARQQFQNLGGRIGQYYSQCIQLNE